MSEKHPAQKRSPVLTGLMGRCYRCGKGHLFRSLLALHEKCPDCGQDFSEADPADGPAVFVMFIVGFLLIPLAVWMDFAFHPPLWVHIVVWGPAIVIASIVFLRLTKGILTNLQLYHDAREARPDDVPRGGRDG